MKKLNLILMGLFCYVNSHAQKIPEQRWSVTTQPSAIFHPVYPALQFGMEKGVGQFGVLAETGLLLTNSVYHKDNSILGLGDFSSQNSGGFLRLEGKYYINRMFYVSVNLQYLYNHYRRTDTFDATPELTASVSGNYFCTTCVEESYDIVKNMLGASTRIGSRFPLGQHLALDVFAGVGLNYHMNQHSGDAELHKNPARADGLFSYFDMHYPGKFLYKLPAPTLGFRFAYTFGDPMK